MASGELRLVVGEWEELRAVDLPLVGWVERVVMADLGYRAYVILWKI